MCILEFLGVLGVLKGFRAFWGLGFWSFGVMNSGCRGFGSVEARDRNMTVSGSLLDTVLHFCYP